MKKYKVGLFQGRLQPIHRGHQKSIDRMLKECEKGIVLLGSAQESGTPNNPFNLLVRAKLVREIYPQKELLIGYFPDLSLRTTTLEKYQHWGDWIMECCKLLFNCQPEIIYSGADTKNEAIYKNYDLKIITTSRDSDLSRGTQVREFLRLGDEESWRKLVDPKIHQHYDELRKLVSLANSNYQAWEPPRW